MEWVIISKREYVKANANFGPGLYEMEACTVTSDQGKPEWIMAGTMAEGRSFLGSAAVGGKVIYYVVHNFYITIYIHLHWMASCQRM